MKGKENRGIRKKKKRENKCMSKGENESTMPSSPVNPSLPLQFNKKT